MEDHGLRGRSVGCGGAIPPNALSRSSLVRSVMGRPCLFGLVIERRDQVPFDGG